MNRVAALCSGYGGLELALNLLHISHTVTWYAETDQHAANVFAAHHPDATNHGDLTEITSPPPVDIVTAGFPCQPVSHAGKRKGIHDERWLIEDVCRIGRETGAHTLILENVAGLLSANGGDAMARVVSALAENGFDARWTCVRASDIGAPHQRLRWFCIAYAESAERRTPQPQLLGSTVGPTTEHRERNSEAASDPDGDGHGARKDGGGMGRMDRQDARQTRQRQRSWKEPGDRSNATPPDTGRVSAQIPDIREQSAIQESRSTCETRRTNWGPYEPAIRRWEHLLGRPAPQPTDDRNRLEPRFVEWMMGLPDGHVTNIITNRTHALRILGNGVVPQQAAYALTQLGNSQ